MPTDPPRVICFDWGGVILRICRNWREGCAAAGLPVRDGSDDPSMSARRHELAELYQLGRLACEEFCEQIARTTTGLYTPDEIGRIHDAWLIAEYDGVAELVEQLASNAPAELGLLSNTNKRHYDRHRPTPDGRAPDFPTIARLHHHIASHEIGASKPSDAIYRAFEDLTGVRGTEILFFDDLADNIASARTLGWRAVQIDHTADTAAQIRAALASHGIDLTSNA